MKKLMLMVALTLVSANAIADRVVSGTNETDKASGESRSEACKTAKADALIKRTYDEQLAKYSPCECKQNEKGSWACTVDATLEKTR